MRYLVESYLPAASGRGHADVEERALAAADALASGGVLIRLLNCIFVPQDEMFLLIYEAASAESVRDACHRAGIDCERVLETAGGIEVGSQEVQEESQ